MVAPLLYNKSGWLLNRTYRLTALHILVVAIATLRHNCIAPTPFHSCAVFSHPDDTHILLKSPCYTIHPPSHSSIYTSTRPLLACFVPAHLWLNTGVELEQISWIQLETSRTAVYILVTRASRSADACVLTMLQPTLVQTFRVVSRASVHPCIKHQTSAQGRGTWEAIGVILSVLHILLLRVFGADRVWVYERRSDSGNWPGTLRCEHAQLSPKTEARRRLWGSGGPTGEEKGEEQGKI